MKFRSTAKAERLRDNHGGDEIATVLGRDKLTLLYLAYLVPKRTQRRALDGPHRILEETSWRSGVVQELGPDRTVAVRVANRIPDIVPRLP